MANGIVWYGERGIVNALVADLSSRGEDGAASGVKSLLGAVRWGDTADRGGQADDQAEPPAWTAGITRVTFLVEVGASQFGNPDLIIVCEMVTSSPHAVLIEAKVVPYLGSAMSNDVRREMAARGYNSSINGQLALRYRLTHALAQPRGRPQLVEPATLHAQYRDQLGDPTIHPRRLNDPCVCGIFDPIRELPPEHYHLVAWTWDREPFFGGDTPVSQEFVPCFLARDGTDAWDTIRSRVGWLGFGGVEQSVHPGHTYETARRTMLPTLAPSTTVVAVPPAPPLYAGRGQPFSAATLARVARLTNQAAELVGTTRSAAGDANSLAFSCIVQGKVTPWWDGDEERVLIGIRSTLSPLDWRPGRADDLGLRKTGTGRGLGVFYFIRVPADPTEAELVAGEIFQQIAERVGS